MKKRFLNCFSKPSILFLVIFIITSVLWGVAAFNPAFADFLVSTVGYAIRRVLSFVFSFTPFSLMEILFVLFIALIVIHAVFVLRRCKSRVKIISNIVSVFSVFALIISLYAFSLGIGYRKTSISQGLSLDTGVEINTETLYRTLNILKEETEKTLGEVEFDASGASVCPHSLEKISEIISDAYGIIDKKYPGLNLKNFNSKAKTAISGAILTDLEILGIYSFYTGEATVNTKYPDYTLPFSVAHEFAHQRGISRENEANFMAFLACVNSGDAYITYSGYLNMFEYVAASLNKADERLTVELYKTLDGRIIQEMRRYSEFYYENKNEFLSDLSSFFNDKYLKLQGTEGVVSYGLVTRLCVAYYCEE